MDFLLFRRLFNLTRDIIFIFVISSRAGKKSESKIKFVFGALCVCSLIFMYSSENGGFFSDSIVRSAYRTAMCYVYLSVSRGISKPVSLYLGLLLNNVIVISHNIFMTPMTRPFLMGTIHLVPNSSVNLFCLFVIVNIVVLAVFFAVYKLLPIESIDRITKTRVVMIAILSFVVTYINHTIENFPNGIDYSDILFSDEISIFLIILQFSLLLCLIFIENIQRDNTVLLAEKEKAMAYTSLLESIREQQINDEKIRTFRHDIKNHLFSIIYYLENGRSDAALSFAKKLLDEYTKTRPVVQTNNLILDGILSRKIAEAEAQQISVTVNADFSKIGFIEDIDLCAIFGNILDNAIEACYSVEESDGRYIDILCRENIGRIFIIVKNPYRKVLFHKEEPVTTKSDSALHGFGLKSIRRSIAKYGGDLSVSVDEAIHQFTTVLSLPNEGSDS